jgi:hypothetical protein
MVRPGGGAAHPVRPLSARPPRSPDGLMRQSSNLLLHAKFDAAIRPSCSAGLVVRSDGGESHTSSGRSEERVRAIISELGNGKLEQEPTNG